MTKINYYRLDRQPKKRNPIAKDLSDRELLPKIIENKKISHDQDKRNYLVDYTKIKTFGFECTETIDDGIKALIKVYKNL